MSQSYDLGKLGEELAVRHLQQEGCTILQTRWRHHHLELDIIATNGAEIIIAEVKTRSTQEFGDPLDSIDHKKILRIVRATDAYLKQNYIHLPYRFDLFAILIHPDGTVAELRHLEDAFYPPLG